MILTVWIAADFHFFEQDADNDPITQFKLSDLHKGTTAALIEYSLAQANRLRKTAYVTLIAVGVLISISVLAVLFAGLITQLDLRGTDTLAQAQREYDRIVAERDQAIVTSVQATAAFKFEDEKRRRSPEAVIGNNLSTPGSSSNEAAPIIEFDNGYFTELQTASEVAHSRLERLRKLEDDAVSQLNFIKKKQAEKSGATTDLSELNSQSLIASAVTRFGVAALLLFFAQALVNLYRYTLRLSTFYHSRAMILSFCDGNIEKIEKITPHLSADMVPFGKDVQTPIEQVVKVAEILNK